MEKVSAGKVPGTGKLISTVKVTCFTDPLCCWTFGMQPHLDQLQAHFGAGMQINYRMGGMLPSWDRFHDEANAVSRPAQMGPVWMHAAQLTGRPMYHQLWIKNPPASSYPAWIAVKCAALQSSQAGIACFRLLQEAAFINGQNIADAKVIYSIAADVCSEHPLFDLKKFMADYQQGKSIDAFRRDLAMVRQHNITRFPTLIIEVRSYKGILLTGYRTCESILQVIEQAFPGLSNAP